MKARLYTAPKAGHSEGEYEDAAAYGPEKGLPVWAAVTDGATESAFAGGWARGLADGFVSARIEGPTGMTRALDGWQAAWGEAVAARAASLPWYAAAKAEEGAFAALVGLVIRPGGTWQALAAGDCCLFHLKPDGGFASWPFEDPAAFTHRPALLGSRPGTPIPPLLAREGTWQPGDAFVLATDALAAWLLTAGPARALAWTEVGFQQEVVAARAAGTLRNDDVTALVLQP